MGDGPMATTLRSDLVEQLEKALTDEAYDGGNGALNEEQFTRLVRALAATAAEVVGETHVPAEEPDWEYGYRLMGVDGNVYKTGFAYDDPDEAAERGRVRAAEENEAHEERGEPRLVSVLIHRHKAGPWVPVKQGEPDV